MLSNLKPAYGSKKKNKRKGCGPGSGHGKTACRGEKGQGSRSGVSFRPGFEGGQMPLFRRIGKRGFTNIFALDYAVVNLEVLSRFEAGSRVTAQLLLDKGYIAQIGDNGIKVLGGGELKVALTVVANAASAGAKEKIEKAGGSVELIALPVRRAKFQKKGEKAPAPGKPKTKS
jgi:large subunit ribosomal protein L15